MIRATVKLSINSIPFPIRFIAIHCDSFQFQQVNRLPSVRKESRLNRSECGDYPLSPIKCVYLSLRRDWAPAAVHRWIQLCSIHTTNPRRNPVSLPFDPVFPISWIQTSWNAGGQQCQFLINYRLFTALDWSPNVMASEEISSASATSSSGGGAGEGGAGADGVGEGGGSSGGAVAFLTNHAALSITLVAGSFFVTLNLLLFVAIYRRRFELTARRKRTVILFISLSLSFLHFFSKLGTNHETKESSLFLRRYHIINSFQSTRNRVSTLNIQKPRMNKECSSLWINDQLRHELFQWIIQIILHWSIQFTPH